MLRTRFIVYTRLRIPFVCHILQKAVIQAVLSQISLFSESRHLTATTSRMRSHAPFEHAPIDPKTYIWTFVLCVCVT